MGTDGPVSLSYTNTYSGTHNYWHDTLESLGVQTSESFLSGSNVGAWTSIVCVDPTTGRRAYSATSYYEPNSTRKNLVVLTEATAREVVHEQDNGKWTAKGVKFSCGGAEFTVAASKEVILSAGTVGSPHLLELSGIGIPSVLEAAGIPVKVANNNVGENLQDHISKPVLPLRLGPRLHLYLISIPLTTFPQ